MITSPELAALSRNPAWQEKWIAIYNALEFQVLIKHINEACLLQAQVSVVPGLHPDTSLSREYHRILGNQEVLNVMKNLSKGIALPEYQPEPEQFAHLTQD